MFRLVNSIQQSKRIRSKLIQQRLKRKEVSPI